MPLNKHSYLFDANRAGGVRMYQCRFCGGKTFVPHGYIVKCCPQCLQHDPRLVNLSGSKDAKMEMFNYYKTVTKDNKVIVSFAQHVYRAEYANYVSHTIPSFYRLIFDLNNGNTLQYDHNRILNVTYVRTCTAECTHIEGGDQALLDAANHIEARLSAPLVNKTTWTNIIRSLRLPQFNSQYFVKCLLGLGHSGWKPHRVPILNGPRNSSWIDVMQDRYHLSDIVTEMVYGFAENVKPHDYALKNYMNTLIAVCYLLPNKRAVPTFMQGLPPNVLLYQIDYTIHYMRTRIPHYHKYMLDHPDWYDLIWANAEQLKFGGLRLFPPDEYECALKHDIWQ